MKTAIDQIRELCERKGDSFEEMRDDYLREGFVVANPQAALFLLPVKLEGEEAWFVKAAAGKLSLLANMFPCFKPRVIFDRAGKGDRTRVYDSRRLYALARKTGTNSETRKPGKETPAKPLHGFLASELTRS